MLTQKRNRLVPFSGFVRCPKCYRLLQKTMMRNHPNPRYSKDWYLAFGEASFSSVKTKNIQVVGECMKHGFQKVAV